MWWILKNSSLEGPLTAEQVQKRVALNMLGSLDRISEDKKIGCMLEIPFFGTPVEPFGRTR